MVKVDVEKDTLGLLQVAINGTNFGVFDAIDRDGEFAWFPKRTDRLSGSEIIAIGEALNKVNCTQN